MPCDECAMHRYQLDEAHRTVAHLEGVIASRTVNDSREGDMNRYLHAEVSRLQRRVMALEAELTWRDADV